MLGSINLGTGTILPVACVYFLNCLFLFPPAGNNSE